MKTVDATTLRTLVLFATAGLSLHADVRTSNKKKAAKGKGDHELCLRICRGLELALQETPFAPEIGDILTDVWPNLREYVEAEPLCKNFGDILRFVVLKHASGDLDSIAREDIEAFLK